MKRFFSIFLVYFAFWACVYAQVDKSASSVSETIDSLRQSKFSKFFEGCAVGVDVVGPVLKQVSGQGEYQAFLQLNIKGKYLPIIEAGYGLSDKKYDLTDITYKTKAPFGRIGCDFNVLKNKHDDYRLVIGVRYGFTSFNYDTTSPTDSLHTTFSTVTDSYTLHWGELVFGVDAKVWGPLHMGWSVRYRRRIYGSEHTKDPLYAPGFGNAADGTSIMALYNIGIQL